jgi:transposase
MDVMFERCCGLDVHKKTVVACVIVSQPTGAPERAVQTFGTMTEDLLRRADWLESWRVSHVAMESTGVYWQAIWNLLEGRFALLLVNAQHVHQVPGRKTDVRDCEWLADLLRHGLLRGSFVPDRAQRELRELVRYRTGLVRQRAQVVNRVQKTLEGANVKLASVATNVVGVSGRAMLQALVRGEADPAALAEQARGRMRTKRVDLERALTGRIGPHQQFLLRQQLALLEALESAIEQANAEVARRLEAQAEQVERLDAIPGLGRRTAEIILAELGPDLMRFSSAAHLASWAGLCPGNHESAGRQRTGRTRKGNPWLRTALVEAAQAAARTKGSYLAAQFRRLAARRGIKKALVAVAHTLLGIIYALLTRGATYTDLGASYFDARDRHHTSRRLVARLEGLGFRVSLEPLAATG